METKNIFVDSKDVTSDELIDVQLEAQFELDYNSPEGLYKIVFNITDKNSGKIVSAQTEFELKEVKERFSLLALREESIFCQQNRLQLRGST